jgi:hypothetical protein
VHAAALVVFRVLVGAVTLKGLPGHLALSIILSVILSGSRMRIFKNAWFARFARAQGITDPLLVEAVERAERGQVDADLGGGVLKQRVARSGRGRSRGYRVLVLVCPDERAFFVYGFAKSDRGAIRRDELVQFKKLAGHMCRLDDTQLDALIEAGRLEEVGVGGQ